MKHVSVPVQCVVCWVETTIVFFVDILLLFNLRNTSVVRWDVFFIDAVACISAIDENTVLLVWLLVHLLIHSLWLFSSFEVLAGMFMFHAPRWKALLPWTTITVIICIADLVAAIQFSVIAASVYDCKPSTENCCCDESLKVTTIFFPLYFMKGVIFWIVNWTMAYFMWKLSRNLKRDSKKKMRAIFHEVVSYRRTKKYVNFSASAVTSFYNSEAMSENKLECCEHDQLEMESQSSEATSCDKLSYCESINHENDLFTISQSIFNSVNTESHPRVTFDMSSSRWIKYCDEMGSAQDHRRWDAFANKEPS